MNNFFTAWRIGGVVLAGGKSSRMAPLCKNKALLTFGEEQTLLHRNMELLQEYCAQVWVSCAQNAAYADFTCVPDVFPHAGPVGGVHAALQYARKLDLDAVLVLACDMPAVQRENIASLLQTRAQALTAHSQRPLGKQELKDVHLAKDAPLLTAFYEQETGRLQTLMAVYEVAALPYFAWALSQEEQKLKLSRLIPQERQIRIAYSQSMQPEAFINLNTPQDVATYAAWSESPSCRK